MTEGMLNQLETMPAKALKDLRAKKMEVVTELKKEELVKTPMITIRLTNLEKQIETIDVFIKKRGIK